MVAIDGHPQTEEVPIKKVIEAFPELKANPFANEMCSTFSSTNDRTTCMTFTDFVDMASCFSENAPPQFKADWAFKIFGKLSYLSKHFQLISILQILTKTEESVKTI